jgi:uncharacterized protein YbaR (Trm112 family)
MTSRLASHLNLLVCPVCHAALRLDEATIQCTGCRRSYPIVDGLPVLIESRASLPAENPPTPARIPASNGE